MNIKSLIPTSFGLGIFIFIVSYAIQFILKFMVPASAAAIATGVGSFVGAMMFTYYFYPHLMSRVFKLHAILTIFALSMILLTIWLVVTGIWGIYLAGIIDNISNPIQILLLIGVPLFSLAFQGVLLYFGIHFGNKEGLKMLAAAKNKNK